VFLLFIHWHPNPIGLRNAIKTTTIDRSQQKQQKKEAKKKREVGNLPIYYLFFLNACMNQLEKYYGKYSFDRTTCFFGNTTPN
jgi:hypothetical protein